MRYRLDPKQAEMFARAIMPALYRRQKAKNIQVAMKKKRRYALNEKYGISKGSQLFERYENTVASPGEKGVKS